MEDSVSGKRFRDLQRDYNALEKDYIAALSQLNRATHKLKKQRDEIKSWQNYVDSHPKYVDKRKAKSKTELDHPKTLSLSAAPSPKLGPSKVKHFSEAESAQYRESGVSRSPFKDAVDYDKIAGPGEHTVNGKVDPRDSDLPERPVDGLYPLTGKPPVAEQAHRSSSQSTQVDSDDRIDTPIKEEPQDDDDDDEPLVISARQVRKPRSSTTREMGSLHAGTFADPCKIKREDTDQTQSISNVPAYLRTSTQASDLDQFFDHVETPRKRQRLVRLDMEAEDEENARTVRASRAEKMNALLRKPSDENTPPPASQTSRASQYSNISRSPISCGPLKSLDTKSPTMPRPDHHRPKVSQPLDDCLEQRTAQNVRDLAEDDTNIASPENLLQKKQRTPRNLITPQAQANTRSSSPSIPAPRPKRPLPPTTPTLAPTKRPRSSPSPERESLRHRPLHRLRPDDFRINPLYAGTDYAFNARPPPDRAARLCIPGCTRSCCVALQHFATETRPAPAEAHDDGALLRAHLGRDPATLTFSQRASLLASARAQKVADRYGRHRPVFERRRTPPGFWRTEMPSTQEMDEDRAVAKRVEREEVEERWREAVRGDGKGRWVFRDQKGVDKGKRRGS